MIARTSLDLYAGSTRSFLSDPAIDGLPHALSLGFGGVLLRGCAVFGVYPGCTGVAIAVAKEEEKGVIYAALKFSDETKAENAFPAIRLNAGFELGPNPLEPTKLAPAEVLRDGSIIWVKAVGAFSELFLDSRLCLSPNLPGLSSSFSPCILVSLHG